jgi:hypothetical protein
LPEKELSWESGFTSEVSVDRRAKVWHCEMRIPLQSLSLTAPKPGTVWRLNLFRADRANRAFLAFRPTLRGSFHVPDRFGSLEFVE